MRRKKSDDWARFLKQMMIIESECIEENYGEGRGLNDSDEENNAETRRDFASLQAMLPTLLAAPDLLAALRGCRAWVVQDVEHYEDGGGEEWAGSVKLLKQINKAINKAEGRGE
jgi:hypothetical protein